MEIPLEIDCRSVQKRRDCDPELLLLDCRERDEYETARIEGAMLFPMSELLDRRRELDQFRNREIVVYCHHGARSMQVAHWLRSQGFATAQSMAGGIDQWSQQIDPATPRY